MRMMSGWMRAGMVAAMMVAAASAGAQTTAEDAAKVADAQAQVAAQQADVAAQAAKIEADVQAQNAKSWIKVDSLSADDAKAQLAKLQALNSANSEVQTVRIQAQLAKLSALNAADSQMQAARIQGQLARLAPMQAKLEMSMVPLQAEMLARSAVMQAQMMAHTIVLQDGMVSVGDPQVKDDLFAGTEKFAAGASDVTDVNLGPDMLGMVSGKHGGDMAHKLNFMVVRTYEYPRPGMYKMEDVEVYRQKLRAGNWNCFIHTHESKSGESTDICNRALPNNEGNEMVILTVEPQELTFIHMSGKGSLADLGKMGNRMGGMGGVVIPDPPDPPTPPAAPSAPHP